MVDEQKLRDLAGAASQGDWEHCILDRPLDIIAEYVGECIKKSGGDEFHFVIGQHPDGGGADLCHTGNGQKSSDNADWIAAANPAAILSLLDELQTLRSERTAWRVTAENAEAAVKQAREDALEEAKQSLVAMKEQSLAAQTKDAAPMTFADDVNKSIRLATVLLAGAIDGIESLKGKT